MFAVALTEESPLNLPQWSQVGERRRAHIARVVRLIDAWAEAMSLDQTEARAWHDAALLHDALRDADEALLRSLVPRPDLPVGLLHGPAAALLLEREGERRGDVLEAIRHHTVGHSAWARTGRALYMADYLEPGRRFAGEERDALASQVPGDFDAAFREVLRHRLLWTLRQGHELYPEAAALWNSVR